MGTLLTTGGSPVPATADPPTPTAITPAANNPTRARVLHMPHTLV
ncbi:hypothetical protein ACIQUQ_25860 [Streptomyces sp. NPDC101118]